MTETTRETEYVRDEDGEIATFEWRYNSPYYKFAKLIKPGEYAEKFFNKFLKKGCTLFAYETETTKAGGIIPTISINIEKKLVYFWSASDSEKCGFETRGIKINTRLKRPQLSRS